MATLKADKAQAGAQPRAVHAGANTVRAKYALSAALSAGDVIQMAKIPHGAVVEDISVYVQSGDHDAIVSIGDGGAAARFFGSASTGLAVGGVAHMTDGFGYQYDISDDAANQYDTVDITVGTVTSSTATGTITMMLTYNMDEAEP